MRSLIQTLCLIVIAIAHLPNAYAVLSLNGSTVTATIIIVVITATVIHSASESDSLLDWILGRKSKTLDD